MTTNEIIEDLTRIATTLSKSKNYTVRRVAKSILVLILLLEDEEV